MLLLVFTIFIDILHHGCSFVGIMTELLAQPLFFAAKLVKNILA
jgi:hypothetical protein